MRVLALLAVLIFIGFASCRVDIVQVDTFTSDGTNFITIELTTSLLPPVVRTSFFSTGNPDSDEIIGGERDLQLNALTGSSGRVFATSVNLGEWEIATPNGASSQVLMQYDGIDGSINLNSKGLTAITGASGGLDLTIGSTADGFHLTIETDIETDYKFTVYDVSGGSSTLTKPIQGGSVSVDASILFKDFSGNANFNKIGAIEILVEGLPNVDTITNLFALSGPEPSTTPSASKSPTVPSASRSNSPGPSSDRSRSPSRTPPIPPSESRTPSTSPSASPFPTCQCNCPNFRCGLVFDRPETDDDDSASSERVIYRPVFYYAEDDDFDGIEGDRQSTWVIISGRVAEFQEGVDDVGVYLYLSDASSIYTSITLVLISILALVF